MVNGNLGTSVAVLGAFSLIRFRSVPGNSKEIASVFFAMAIGLAVGMGGLTTDSAYFNLGVAGQVGLEYTFWFPLQLSFDIRPVLGLGFNYGFHWSVMPAIGVRYRF